MKGPKVSRRGILNGATQGSAALAMGSVFASPARAEAPEPVAITPALVEAARKEGKLIFHTRETQQFFTDFTAQYSVHAQVQSKPGRRKISDIKLMKEDAAGVEKMAEEIKTRYARLFRV